MKQKRKNKPHAVEDILCEESARNPFIMATRALPHSIPYTMFELESTLHPRRAYYTLLSE